MKFINQLFKRQSNTIEEVNPFDKAMKHIDDMIKGVDELKAINKKKQQLTNEMLDILHEMQQHTNKKIGDK